MSHELGNVGLRTLNVALAKRQLGVLCYLVCSCGHCEEFGSCLVRFSCEIKLVDFSKHPRV